MDLELKGLAALVTGASRGRPRRWRRRVAGSPARSAETGGGSAFDPGAANVAGPADCQRGRHRIS
jgi:hypothetical protein